MSVPLLPVPSKSFPVGDSPMASTRSSRDVQSVCGEPSGAILTTSAPPVEAMLGNGRKIVDCAGFGCDWEIIAPPAPVTGVVDAGGARSCGIRGIPGARDLSPMDAA